MQRIPAVSRETDGMLESWGNAEAMEEGDREFGVFVGFLSFFGLLWRFSEKKKKVKANEKSTRSRTLSVVAVVMM
jgi:hypothetical protein